MVGFTLRKEASVRCQADGNWSKPYPECIPVECPQPEDIPNGIVDVQGLMYLSTTVYSCKAGYDLAGNSTPKCIPADCGLPPHIDFDDALTSQHLPVDNSFLHGSLVQYHCHAGYVIKGDIVLMCQEDGTWNGTAPVCAPAQCDTPPSPEYGSVMVTDSVLGSLAEYSCEEGYELNGQTIRQCISGKQWSDDTPRCLPISCGNPGGIANGEVIGKYFHFKALIHYECHKGFVLEGVETRTCQVDGKWDNKAPSCRAVSCGRPVVSKDVLVRGDDYTFGKRLLFSCNLGFIPQGTPTSVCLANGSWSEAPPKCLPANCGQPPVIENGRVTGTDYGYNGMVRYACDIGYILRGNPTLICRADGLWDDPPPRCDISSFTMCC
uniref:Sushi domain-containing protein n=1 Tax=Cyprinus carpio TaxID=7962 RepID=A0A8C2FGY8_CYPCA